MAQGHGPGEHRDIRRTLRQRRQRQGKDIEPVKQVGAEPALRNLERQVAVGAGDDPHVDLYRGGRTDWHDFLFLQCSKQLGLERQGHLGDLVEQQGAAIGCPHEALAFRIGAGESALAVAEQHGLKHGLGHRRAIDRDERPIGARASRMDEAAEHFLAGPGRPADQYRHVAPGDALGQREDREAFGIDGKRLAVAGHGGDQHAQCSLAQRIAVDDTHVRRAAAHDRAMIAAFEIDDPCARRWRRVIVPIAQMDCPIRKQRVAHCRQPLQQRRVPVPCFLRESDRTHRHSPVWR